MLFPWLLVHMTSPKSALRVDPLLMGTDNEGRVQGSVEFS